MPGRQKIVKHFIALLDSRQDLKNAVESSLTEADLPHIKTLEEFCSFLDKNLTHIPTENELMPSVREFYFILSKSPGDLLKKDKIFNDWVNDFVNSRGNFMDTIESIETLESFIKNPEYKIDDYIKGPSGWLSYNQFLARQLKPGKRPVAARCDETIIVSPADSEYKGEWSIADNSTITVKGTTYSVMDLLSGSAYQHRFKNGIFTHSFLSITDYHRYHAPVGGIVREVKKIVASTWVNETKKPDGSLENTDDVGFQFTHTRGYIIIEAAVGPVAVMPVGMGHISSVILNVEEGATLTKGEEFGYFAFGGSDIIMLFGPASVEFHAKPGTHYNQGEQIAVSIKH